MDARLGEVIEASSMHFLAEAYVLHQAPALGSFVRVDEEGLVIYAVTADVRTGGVDAGRRPAARGRDEVSVEAVYRNNPELPELLRTEFSATVVGFAAGGSFRQHLPPRPPRIHSFVYPCSLQEVRAFTDRLDFLATLVTSGLRGTQDELIAACLRECASSRAPAHDLSGDGASEDDQRRYLVRAGKELARLLGGEVTRLNGILRRMR